MKDFGEEKDRMAAALQVWDELVSETQALEGVAEDVPEQPRVEVSRFGALANDAVDLIYGVNTPLSPEVEARLTRRVADALAKRREVVYAQSSIGARLKTARQRDELSMPGVAQAAGLEETEIAELENDAKDVRAAGPEAIGRWVAACKVHFDDVRASLRRSLAATLPTEALAGRWAELDAIPEEDEVFIQRAEAAWRAAVEEKKGAD